ncbi:MAG: universal stress protein [Dehalococcoidia bacterium]|nr:universal stress protein [Dehalococcoidia bacterium]
MLKTILVPLDGSDIARGILPYVSQIARKTGTPLVLHTAIDLQSMHISETSAMYLDQIEGRLRARALGTLKEIADQLRDASIEVRSEVTVGSPAEEVLRFAGEARCDLIAMSTHGRNAIGRSILGSVTDKIVHSADVPVLTINPETARKYQEQEGMTLNRVILPMDGSQLAEQAVPYAVSLAQAMSLEVELVQVVPTGLPTYAFPG